MKIVVDILAAQEPQYNIIDANVTVLDALTLMHGAGLSFLIVMRDEKYAGIFTEHDYVNKVLLKEKYAHSALVKEVMQADLPNVCSTDSAEHCIMMMNSFKTRYLPVFDNFDFVAVLTFNDLVSEALDDQELMPIMHDVIKRNWVGDNYSKFHSAGIYHKPAAIHSTGKSKTVH